MDMVIKEQIINNYPFLDNEILADKLGISVVNLRRKASVLGIKKASPYEIYNGKKLCSICEKQLPIEEFFKDSWNKSGYRYECKSCYEKKHGKQQEAPAPEEPKVNNYKSKTLYETKVLVTHRPMNPIVYQGGIKGKVCNGCKTWKPLTDYGKDKKGIAGVRARCKECYKNNRQKVKGE